MVEDTISRKRMTPASGPLDDFRIIELAGIGPAPHCGQLLADMGAEVILVDRPGPPLPFLERRGKKSIVLNLQNPDSIEALLRLVEGADALMRVWRAMILIICQLLGRFIALAMKIKRRHRQLICWEILGAGLQSWRSASWRAF